MNWAFPRIMKACPTPLFVYPDGRLGLLTMADKFASMTTVS
jgi:hypothetical protein